jgi:hypothetical protein
MLFGQPGRHILRLGDCRCDGVRRRGLVCLQAVSNKRLSGARLHSPTLKIAPIFEHPLALIG